MGQTLELAIDRLRTSGLPGAESLHEEFERRAGIDLGDDVAGWLGAVSGFVAGGSTADLAIGLVAETSDPEGRAGRGGFNTLDIAAAYRAGLSSNCFMATMASS